MKAAKKRLCFADGKVYKIFFQVGWSTDRKKWFADSDRFDTIEAAIARMKELEVENAANIGKTAISVCGSIVINMGYKVEKQFFRVVKVTKEVVA